MLILSSTTVFPYLTVTFLTDNIAVPPVYIREYFMISDKRDKSEQRVGGYRYTLKKTAAAGYGRERREKKIQTGGYYSAPFPELQK